MNRLTLVLAIAAFVPTAAVTPALAEQVSLRKPNASLVTEGLVVSCALKANRLAAEIVEAQLEFSGKAKGKVTVSPGFCNAFLAEVRGKAPNFVRAVQQRIDQDGTTAETDPAPQAAKGGKKKKTTTTTTTTSGGTTTTVTTTVTTQDNGAGGTTVTETISIN